ncbi:MAG: Coenzyme F420 hydrogenase/dehydrogenase, beta subunit C-terminal domain [Candidatus Bathyarchaeia archaeon]
MEIFGKEPDNKLLGNYIVSYIGYSTDNHIRYNSSSGGMVTQILTFILDKGIIDGAIVTRMSDHDPLEAEPFIARTKEDVIEASKSKYCPVPVNVVLKEVLKSRSNERFAIVGLPCHIQGVRKAEVVNKVLRERIILHLGLFCGHAPTFSATEFLLQKLNVKKEDVRRIHYRSEGWPGGLSVLLKNGTKVFIPFNSPYYWGLIFGQFFFTKRCSICADKLCELADLSFGDAWLPELMYDKLGASFVIARSKRGERILREALREGVIKLEKISADKILQSQRTYIAKRRAKARTSILNLFYRRIPCINHELPDPTQLDYLRAILFYPLNHIMSKKSSRKLLDIYVKFARLFPILSVV